MRRRIFIAFTLIFTLFLAGSGITVYQLVATTGKLRHLIGLHQIEDIRKDLFSSVLKVSSYVFASPDVLKDHLEEIIRNTNAMHSAIRRCNDCHHEPAIEKQLLETQKMGDYFEEQLSFLITIESDKERRHSQQELVHHASTEILDRVQNMVNAAALVIETRTSDAMDELNRVYFLVGATLFCTIVLALLIARYLARNITEPIDTLVSSTRKITEGNWGYQIGSHATDELQELIDSFNQMSESLAIKKEQEQLHLQKLQDTQKQLIEAEKLSALGTMAGGIAHDFNNILCGMIGHLNILARQIPQEEANRKTIETIEKAGFRAADLVKQLLTFARQKPMELKAIKLNKCVDDVVQLIGNTLDKRISLQLELADKLPAVLGDASQLEQVIINLCFNARDAMPEGGDIFLSTELFVPDETFLTHHRDAIQKPYVLLTARDTGSGINEKVLPRIFDPFFTTKEVGKGTGLGLAMVYGIVQNHEGFCTIESTPGRGTTVKVYLPSIGGQEDKQVTTAPPASPKGKTILIVDDESMVVTMLKSHLEDLGCRVMTAENGQVAVDILKENKDEIDLIILDINMPVMCGRDAYQEFILIKPDVRVLVSTGHVMSEETAEVLNMGAQGFLQKPYKIDDINAKIVEILGQTPGT